MPQTLRMAVNGRRGRTIMRASLPALILVIAALVAVSLLLLAPEWLVDFRGLGDGLSPVDRVKAVTEERRSMLALLAAIGAAIGLYYTHLRHELDRDSNRTDRYTKAVEQLGHDSPDVQLGGIYALERIALDSVRDRVVISEVLSAFIRERAKTNPGHDSEHGPPDAGSERFAGPTTVVRAALTVLARRPSNDLSYPGADLAGADLAGADVPGANLADADLSGADLTGANLTFANLRHAKLVRADLTRANLFHASLIDADMFRANLADADLSGADLTAARMADADLALANLTGANLSVASLISARMVSADLTRADLTHANLADADLSDANLTDANLTRAYLTRANLSGANLSGANLTDANLTGANIFEADFAGVDLTDAQRQSTVSRDS
jgi:uncharacterized protein YjbI with pentapeptide repeats